MVGIALSVPLQLKPIGVFKVPGLVEFVCVSLPLPPWFYAAAQSRSILEQCPPLVQANPHPGPLDYGSEISYSDKIKK